MEPMTPPPAPPTDPNFGAAAEDFKRGGWIVSLLGGAGMLARMLLSDEEHKVVFYVRRIIAGSIVGVLAYFTLHGIEMDGLKKSLIMCTAGAFAPEIFEYLRKKYAKGFDDETEKKDRNRHGSRRNRK